MPSLSVAGTGVILWRFRQAGDNLGMLETNCESSYIAFIRGGIHVPTCSSWVN